MGTGYFSIEPIKTNGCIKLFQLDLKLNITKADIAVLVRGIMILAKILRCPHPSIIADSIRSFGIPRINCLSIKTP
jgi:hypothetical protein